MGDQTELEVGTYLCNYPMSVVLSKTTRPHPGCFWSMGVTEQSKELCEILGFLKQVESPKSSQNFMVITTVGFVPKSAANYGWQNQKPPSGCSAWLRGRLWVVRRIRATSSNGSKSGKAPWHNLESKKQGKWWWEWMWWQCQRPGTGEKLPASQALPWQQCHHHPWFPRQLCCPHQLFCFRFHQGKLKKISMEWWFLSHTSTFSGNESPVLLSGAVHTRNEPHSSSWGTGMGALCLSILNQSTQQNTCRNISQITLLKRPLRAQRLAWRCSWAAKEVKIVLWMEQLEVSSASPRMEQEEEAWDRTGQQQFQSRFALCPQCCSEMPPQVLIFPPPVPSLSHNMLMSLLAQIFPAINWLKALFLAPNRVLRCSRKVIPARGAQPPNRGTKTTKMFILGCSGCWWLTLPSLWPPDAAWLGFSFLQAGRWQNCNSLSHCTGFLCWGVTTIPGAGCWVSRESQQFPALGQMHILSEGQIHTLLFQTHLGMWGSRDTFPCASHSRTSCRI